MELFFLDVLGRKLFSFSTRKSHVCTLVTGPLLETEAFWPLHWLPDLLHLMLTSFCDFIEPTQAIRNNAHLKRLHLFSLTKYISPYGVKLKGSKI